MSKNLVENFNDDIKKVMEFINSDKKDEARVFFNDIIFKKYGKLIRDKENPLVFFEIFFTELDDYLNNEGAIMLGVISKNDILKDYSGYKEDLRLALEREQNNKG
ncbi:MAG: hypothetical protein PHC85_00560 [Candidatus Pacebacteria bacterium]|nr:hypothetical protein [Candidatus Paceibacterota bacterium]